MIRPTPASSRSHTRRPSERNCDGFVLVAALLAIVLIGALVTGVLFATTEDTRSGTAAVSRDVALIATESAVATTISDLVPMLPASIGVAGTTSHRVDGFGTPVVVYITRLDSSVYWIVADAIADASRSGGRRRIGILLETLKPADSSIRVVPISQRYWSELF